VSTQQILAAVESAKISTVTELLTALMQPSTPPIWDIVAAADRVLPDNPGATAFLHRLVCWFVRSQTLFIPFWSWIVAAILFAILSISGLISRLAH
jgi:hypothetical protein